jgi:phage gp36-like protein
MAYATLAQIKDAAGGETPFVELFDYDGDGAVAGEDLTRVERLQTAVERWMDSYLGTRFGVPLADPSGAFGELAAAEIVFKARADKPGLGATEDQRKEHDDRVKWVRDLAAGRATPADPPPARATSVRAAWVSRDTDPVSREGLKGAW